MPPWVERGRLYIVNAFIVSMILVVVVDTSPLTPLTVRLKLMPVLNGLGIYQGPWNMFTPGPDNVNTRLRVEITYRDGEIREWQSPVWNRASVWENWVGYRYRQWYDHVLPLQPAWEPWFRDLARTLRPELNQADKGADVRMMVSEGIIPPPGDGRWPSLTQPLGFHQRLQIALELPSNPAERAIVKISYMK
jgi:hypothetical protein